MLGIFLDRDGTLIVDKHYLKDPTDVELIPGTVEAMEIFLRLNCKLFLFSNQSGVSRGLLTLKDVEACNSKMLEKIGLGDIFDDQCIATEGPDDTVKYRKPSPRFINEMRRKYSLNQDQCFVIGDKSCDILAGINAKIRPVFINTGCEKTDDVKNLIQNRQCLEFLSVLEFAKFLFSHV